MKKLYFIILLALFIARAHADQLTNVIYGNAADYRLNPAKKVTVALSLTDTNGYFAFTNLQWGYYTLTISGRAGTEFPYFVQPDSSGNVAFGSLIPPHSPQPPNPASNYYTKADIDALVAGIPFVTQLLAGPNVTLSPVNGLGAVTISATGTNGGGGGSSGGETNTGVNIGSGVGVFSGKSGVALQFKNITTSGGATVSTNANTLTIAAEAPGAGLAAATAATNGLPWSVLYDPAGAAATVLSQATAATIAATNALGLASGLAANRPTNSFASTNPASSTVLGPVKVDNVTITAASDGTISAVNGGSGNVLGPAFAADSTFVFYSGNTGKVITNRNATGTYTPASFDPSGASTAATNSLASNSVLRVTSEGNFNTIFNTNGNFHMQVGRNGVSGSEDELQLNDGFSNGDSIAGFSAYFKITLDAATANYFFNSHGANQQAEVEYSSYHAPILYLNEMDPNGDYSPSNSIITIDGTKGLNGTVSNRYGRSLIITAESSLHGTAGGNIYLGGGKGDTGHPDGHVYATNLSLQGTLNQGTAVAAIGVDSNGNATTNSVPGGSSGVDQTNAIGIASSKMAFRDTNSVPSFVQTLTNVHGGTYITATEGLEIDGQRSVVVDMTDTQFKSAFTANLGGSFTLEPDFEALTNSLVPSDASSTTNTYAVFDANGIMRGTNDGGSLSNLLGGSTVSGDSTITATPSRITSGKALGSTNYALHVVSGGSSPMVVSNILIQSTNEIVWDIQQVQHLTLRFNTNLGMLTISNIWAITNAKSGIVQLDTWEDTNGTWRVLSTNVVGGLMRTFSGWIRGTNASQYDMLSLRLDGTLTNVLADWKTNAQPVESFTNTLTAGGGGGGGGTWTILGSALGDTFDADGCNSSAHPLDATGANLLVAVQSYAGGSGPTGFTNNTLANVWTATTGFSSSNPKVTWQYVISPNVNSSMVFTNPLHSSFKTPFVVYAIQRSGGAPTFGSEATANYFDWRSGGTPAGTANGASVTPFGSSDLILSGITYDTDGTTTLSVDSSFTKVALIPISGGGNYAACAAYKIKSSSSSAEDPGWSWSSSTPFATISIDNITFH